MINYQYFNNIRYFILFLFERKILFLIYLHAFNVILMICKLSLLWKTLALSINIPLEAHFKYADLFSDTILINLTINLSYLLIIIQQQVKKYTINYQHFNNIHCFTLYLFVRKMHFIIHLNAFDVILLICSINSTMKKDMGTRRVLYLNFICLYATPPF